MCFDVYLRTVECRITYTRRIIELKTKVKSAAAMRAWAIETRQEQNILKNYSIENEDEVGCGNVYISNRGTTGTKCCEKLYWCWIWNCYLIIFDTSRTVIDKYRSHYMKTLKKKYRETLKKYWKKTERFWNNFRNILTRQWPYHCLTDRSFFFNLVFYLVRQWPYYGLQTELFSFFFKHIFNPKRQWPYHSLTDWVTSRCKMS